MAVVFINPLELFIVIVTVPCAIPVTTPSSFTFATFSLLLDHTNPSVDPIDGFFVADSVTLLPTSTSASFGLTVIPIIFVYYERAERIAGESHYPLKKMLSFAFDGITSFSVKPISMITSMGFIVCVISLIAIVATIIEKICGMTVGGWSSLLCCILFLGGVQLLSLGVIGEYIGKIYMETKERPRFIISESTGDITPAKDRR